MLTVITYDVDTGDAAGRRRLRKVARVCVNYGQRVQNSVFECDADAATFARVKEELTALIDPEKDSLRFYYLGNRYQAKIEHVGAKPSYDPEGFFGLVRRARQCEGEAVAKALGGSHLKPALFASVFSPESCIRSSSLNIWFGL